MLKGIDIYEGDNVQDWNAVKNAGIEVVIQKATQGITHVDKLLNYRYPLIKSTGLKIGFYHFASYNSENPTEEAQHFLDTINNLKSDTVLWLDLEAAEKWNKQTAIDYANAFINYVQAKGFKIGIYTGASFYYEYLQGNIPNVPLWLASYGKEPNLYTNGTASWQYSESGSLPGIAGNVDLDYFLDNIFINNNSMLIENVKDPKRILQIKALQYNLNLDYNAKLTDADGNIYQSTLNALNSVGKLITKGHKSHVVLWIQQKLQIWGYLKSNSYAKMVYDEPTFQAITNLQKNWGRSTSGILDLDTWKIFLDN